MRYTSLLLLATLSIPSTALAQAGAIVPGRQPTTLDEQLARQQGQPAAPGAYSAAPGGSAYAPASGDYIPPADQLVRVSENNIKYATGGVGDEEEAQLKALEDQFNLKVLSTMEDGAYLGYYALRATDSFGKAVFEAPGNGPYFYVALPPGTYTIDVLRQEQPGKSQKVSVGKVLKTIQFRFPGAAGAKTPAGLQSPQN